MKKQLHCAVAERILWGVYRAYCQHFDKLIPNGLYMILQPVFAFIPFNVSRLLIAKLKEGIHRLNYNQ